MCRTKRYRKMYKHIYGMAMSSSKLQALVYDILPCRKVPQSDARSVVQQLTNRSSTTRRKASLGHTKDPSWHQRSEPMLFILRSNVFPRSERTCGQVQKQKTKKQNVKNANTQLKDFALHAPLRLLQMWPGDSVLY